MPIIVLNSAQQRLLDARTFRTFAWALARSAPGRFGRSASSVLVPLSVIPLVVAVVDPDGARKVTSSSVWAAVGVALLVGTFALDMLRATWSAFQWSQSWNEQLRRENDAMRRG